MTEKQLQRLLGRVFSIWLILIGISFNYGIARAQTVNNIRYAAQFSGADAGAKITACLANLPSTGGTCDARGLEGAQTISSPVVLGSNQTVLLGASTYTFSGTANPGFNAAFRCDAATANCWIKGLGPDATSIKAVASPGTQVDALVQFKSTTNAGLSGVTLDCNSNCTDSLITWLDAGTKLRNVKLKHDLTTNASRNYAWHVRGSQYLDVNGLEASGGAMDGVFVEASTTYGSIIGGQFSHINIYDSPLNCLDIGAVDTASISQMSWSDVRLNGCGTRNVGSDDENGLNVFGSGANSIYLNTFSNFSIGGNKLNGVRVKGRTTLNTFSNFVSTGNGSGASGGYSYRFDLDGGGGGTFPTFNKLIGVGQKGSGTGNLFTSASSAGNTVDLTVGSDGLASLRLGTAADTVWYRDANDRANLVGDLYLSTTGATLKVDNLTGTNFPVAIVGSTISLTGQLTSSLAPGTAPASFATRSVGADPVTNVSFANHPVIYLAGVATASVKVYTGTQALNGGNAIHTFGNRFSFANTNFGCTCTDQTAPNACKAVPASASTVTLAGTGTDTLYLRCEGQ